MFVLIWAVSKYLFALRYVVVENLRYMLSAYNPTDPLYFGCRFKPYVKQGYMSGGAGELHLHFMAYPLQLMIFET